jgi:hypothetical protein
MGLMLQKFMCSMEDRIDVIPVDYCADALLMLLNQPLAHGEVVHLCRGREQREVCGYRPGDGSALEQAPVGDKYAQVSYETLVKMRRELKGFLAPAMSG